MARNEGVLNRVEGARRAGKAIRVAVALLPRPPGVAVQGALTHRRAAGWELGHDVRPRGVRQTGRDDELALTLGEREGGEDRPQSGHHLPNSLSEGRSETRRGNRPRLETA